MNTLQLSTPRLRFHCRCWGEPDGIPLLLLHGSFATSRWWERFGAILPEQFYAVAPDLRGCGASDLSDAGYSDAGYSVEEQTTDVLGLVAALEWNDFHLMAHASSGAIAMQLALEHGELLSTVTLVDSVPVEGVFTPIDTYLLLEQMRSDPALLRQAIKLLMPTLALADGPDAAANRAFVDQLVADAAAMAPAAFTGVARALGQWNRFGDARRLTLPTLLVWGDRDALVDRDATTRTLLAIPGANNLEVLRGVGHAPMIEAPEALLEVFVDFITQDFAGFDALRQSAF